MAPLAMQLLRERSRSTLIYILFAMLIVVFIFTFNTSGSGGCQPGGTAGELASVDGDSIGASMWNMGMEATPGRWRPDSLAADSFVARLMPFYGLKPFQGGDQLKIFSAFEHPIDSPAFEEQPLLKYTGFTRAHTDRDSVKEIHVMNDLIENMLVSQEARKWGLSVSLDAVADRVLQPWFDEESGEFRRDTFEGYLRQLNMSSDSYQKFVEREMLREHVIEVIASMVTISSAEVDGIYADLNNSVRYEYVAVDPKQVAPLVPVTGAEIAESAKDTAAIATYFAANKSRFNTPKSVQVRALLVKAPAQTEIDAATADKKVELAKQRTDAQAKANGFRLEALAGGGDFAKVSAAFSELVKKNSDSTENKTDGGLYATTMNQAYLKQLFGESVATETIALNKGGLTDAIGTDKGFWIMFAEDASAAVTKDVGAATQEIAKTLAREKKAPVWAKQVAQELLAKAKGSNGKELKDIVKEWNDSHRPSADAGAPGGPKQAAPPTTPPVKPAEVKPTAQPVQVKPVEVKPTAQPVQVKPVEVKPVVGQPVEVKPVEVKPVEGEPVVGQPVVGQPVVVEPVVVEPVVVEPVVVEPVVVEPVVVKPVVVEPIEVKPLALNLPFAGMLRAAQSPPVARLGRNYQGQQWEYPIAKNSAATTAEDNKPFDFDDDSWTEVPGVGKNAKMKQALFSLTEQAPVASEVFES
ncbi:MAG: hypothetical protein ACI9OJ_003003, partial [Myxococcota bacterium]